MKIESFTITNLTPFYAVFLEKILVALRFKYPNSDRKNFSEATLSTYYFLHTTAGGVSKCV